MKSLITIPTYNESEALPPTLEHIFKALPNTDVLIVDDNSPDKTWAIVQELIDQKCYGDQLHLLHRIDKRGFASAYMDGFDHFLKGNWDYIQLMDADGSHPIEVLPQFQVAFAQGAQIVVGSRYVEGGGYKDWPWQRVWLSRFGQVYVRTMLGAYYHDWTSGFIAIQRQVMLKMNYRSFNAKGFAVLMEVKLSASLETKNIVEIPIEFVNRQLGESKLNRRIIIEGLRLPLILKLQGWGVKVG